MHAQGLARGLHAGGREGDGYVFWGWWDGAEDQRLEGELHHSVGVVHDFEVDATPGVEVDLLEVDLQPVSARCIAAYEDVQTHRFAEL